MLLKRLFFACLLLLSLKAAAQIPDLSKEAPEQRRGSSILDDSTQQIYGPTTTKFTYLQNIKYNIPVLWSVDTSIFNWHQTQFQYVSKYRNKYVDLGNIGTAMHPVYPLEMDVIGASSGFSLFDPYAYDPAEIKYYRTLSPYSRFKIVWGGEGRSRTEASYTRNINERSNFFFDYRGLFIDKQIGRSGRGDRNAQSINYMFGGNYGSKNGRYQAYGNFTRTRHSVEEIGGVLVSDINDIEAYFDENRQPALSDAQNIELRTNYQLYHQYKLREGFQLYHEYNRFKQQNDFVSVAANDGFFDDIIEVDSLTATLSIRDRSKIVYRQNEVGVKGDFGKSFYNFYYKLKDIDFDYKFLDGDTIGVETDRLENYVGVNIRFGNDSVSFVNAYGEYLVDGNFKLGGSLKNSWIEAEGYTALSQPTFIQEAYLGRHDLWLNNFDDPLTTRIKGALNLKRGFINIKPRASYTLLTNYIYFRELDAAQPRTLEPVQASSEISMITGEVELSVNFMKYLNLNSEIIYTNVSGGSADALRVPDIFVNAQIYFGKAIFKGNLPVQIGFDLHWKSAYFANAYDPAIMQFYVQDVFEVPEYPIVDVFFNAQMKRGRFFFKFNNLYELVNGTGYFYVPGYPGQSPILDFGFDWSFYD
ncbi:MAG: putative porin [Bacteroidota bacterium]